MARDTDAIEKEIQQAREALAGALDELSEKASPQRLSEQGKDGRPEVGRPEDQVRRLRRRRTGGARDPAEAVQVAGDSASPGSDGRGGRTASAIGVSREGPIVSELSKAATEFRRARDAWSGARTPTRRSATSVAAARRVQLGARLVRRRGRRQRAPGAGGRRGGRRSTRRAPSPSCGSARTASRTGCARWACGRGDRVLLMLGNGVPLWEVMLAAMKLGAVIIPADHAARRGDDLRTASSAASVRHVVADAPTADTLRRRARRSVRAIVVGGARPGWRRTPTRTRAGGASRPTARRAPTTRCSSTSPRARPRSRSWSQHTHASYPVGHLSTMYWIGLQPGDVHLNISLAGLGQARLEQLLRPVERRGDDPRLQLRPLRRRAAARRARRAAASPRSARRRRCGGC